MERRPGEARVEPDWHAPLHPALRTLGWFWLATLLLGGGTAAALTWLGAPEHPPVVATAKPVEQVVPPAAPAEPAIPAPPAPAAPAAAPAAAPGPPVVAHGGASVIAPPDPALEETSTDYPGAMLPRMSRDRRLPMRVYAAPAPPADDRPRVAIVLSGIGLLASEDSEALRLLPAPVSLAVSPYAYHPEPLLAQIRAHGHEYLVSVPMEPAGYPLDDAGNRALLTGAAPELNQQRLDWALSRFGGYVGATSAMGNLRGERFAASATLMTPVLQEVASRGLLYVDARANVPHPPGVVGRGADLVLDEPAVRTEIDARLAQLEVLARTHGSAIGVAGPPRPVTVGRIAAWAATLAARGVVLVPVSAVVSIVPPATP